MGGMVKDWAGYSYEISGYDEEGVWGDGITPLESALGLPGAIARVELEVRVRVRASERYRCQSVRGRPSSSD